MIDWARPIETAEAVPRRAEVVGSHNGGTLDYVVVRIADGGSSGSRWHHPPGEYAAFVKNGFIRADLCIRNVC
jgi:hypothetical protein